MGDVTFVDIASFSASLVSVALGVGAIALSLWFFRMSNALAERSNEAAREIRSSIDKLEKVFDSMYSDTFGMVRDTYSDIRKHMWPASGPEADGLVGERAEAIDAKFETLKGEMHEELTEVLRRQHATDGKVEAIAADLSGVVDRAIEQSRQIEIDATLPSEERLHTWMALVDVLRGRQEGLRADRLLALAEAPVGPQDLESMRGVGLVIWEGGPLVRPTSLVRLQRGWSARARALGMRGSDAGMASSQGHADAETH